MTFGPRSEARDISTATELGEVELNWLDDRVSRSTGSFSTISAIIEEARSSTPRRPGSHLALAQYAESIAIQVGEPALNRFDRLRRNRDRSEHGSRTFAKAEVAEAIATAHAIHAACASLV